MDVNKVAAAIQADAGLELPELKQSLTEMKQGKIGRKYSPAQFFIKTVRESAKMSQQRYASLIDTPVGTLRDWEQGRSEPTGSAVKLSGVIQRYPELIEVIKSIRA